MQEKGIQMTLFEYFQDAECFSLKEAVAYVELYSKEDGAWEPFSDLTVNLPGYCLEPGTACISGDFSKENIQFIQEHGLGTLLPWKAQSGMGQYAVVKFHLEELRKFDQAGVAAFCNQHGLQKTMQEERRQSR